MIRRAATEIFVLFIVLTLLLAIGGCVVRGW